jgi:peptidoglycan biosynthesis protein MviN/MurJ (putative lipid II flippase)
LTFSLPLYFPYFIGQFNEIVQNGLAEFLGSVTISVLNYSKQFPIIVQGIMSSVIATVMMPILAKAFKQNNQKEYVQLLNENILLYMAIYGLFACVAIGAASPMCRVLFQYGKMTFEDVDRVISLTRMFTAAFGGVVLYLIFSISLLTTGRNQVYAFIGAFTQIIVLLTNVLLIKKVGVIVFPLSYGIAHLFTALIMFYTLRIEGKSLVAVGICRCLLCIAIATSAFYFANELSCSLSLFLQIITNIVLALIFIPLMLMSMGIDVRKFILYIHSKERA